MDVVRAVPTSTPPTVPWSDPRALAADLRDRLPVRKDPAKAHLRKLGRSRRRASFRTIATAVTGGLAVTVGIEPGLEGAEVLWGGLAVVFGARALNAALRWAELRRMPVPAAAPERVKPARAPWDSPARGPLDRLTERERALAGLLVHLGPAAEEPRAVAADAAAVLRDLGARVTAVDRARRGAPAASLDAAVGELRDRLDAGVTAYSALVVAAADAVAAGATLPTGGLVALRLDEATDSLAGLAAGLRELAG